MRATKKHHVAHQHHHRSDHSRVSLESNTLSLGHIPAKPPPEPRQQAGKQEMSNNSYKVLLWGTWQLVARVAVGGRWCSDTTGQRRDGGGERRREERRGAEGRGLVRRSLEKWEYVTKCSHDSCLLFITRTPSGPKKKKKRCTHVYKSVRACVHAHTLSANLLWQQSVTPWVVTCPAALSQICKHKHRATADSSPSLPDLFKRTSSLLNWNDKIKRINQKRVYSTFHAVVCLMYLKSNTSKNAAHSNLGGNGFWMACTWNAQSPLQVNVMEHFAQLFSVSVLRAQQAGHMTSYWATDIFVGCFIPPVWFAVVSMNSSTWTNDNRLHSLRA